MQRGKKQAPDISAIHADFYMKFYKTVNIAELCKNISENDKIMLFQPRHLPISQHSEL